jgi:signal transduction histidine kinase
MTITRYEMESEMRENLTALSKASSDLTWIKMSRPSLHRERVDLRVFLTRVAEQTPMPIKDKREPLIFDLDPTLGEVETDPTRLRQIIENLLINASKFPPAGEIRLMAKLVEWDGHWIEIAVSDMGIGIPQENHRRIFEPGEHRTLQRNNGVDLGLAICKQLVSVLGGKLLVESAIGTGTTFRVLLPARRKTDQPRRSSTGCPVTEVSSKTHSQHRDYLPAKPESCSQ